MRRFLMLLVMIALAGVGCSKTAPPPATGEGEKGAQTQAPPPVTGGGVEGGAPAPDLAKIITPAPAGTFTRHQIKPGQPIDRTGIFFMKTATGEVEGWSLGDDPNGSAYYDVTSDNRWVSTGQGTVYLLDRKTGAAYQWAVNSASLVAARGDTLLFQTDTQLWTSTADLKRTSPVDLKPEGRVQALIAPDGKAAVLVTGGKVYLLDLATAAVREVGSVAINRDYGQVWLATTAKGAEVLVGTDAVAGAPLNLNEHRIQRFDWTGKKLGEASFPGTPQFSPDGRLVAWPDQLLGFTDVLVVGAGADAAPRFRMVSVDRCPTGRPTGDPWLADSSGLVVAAGNGQGFQLLGAGGTLQPLGALSGERSWEMPVPAPDRADWFAIGGVQVVDGHGKQVAAAVPHSEGKWYGAHASLSPWGERSDEVRFALVFGGKDYGCLPAVLPPYVEKAPFPAITGMEVTVAEGDCVNLRQFYDLTAKVITCMPRGTRLTGATPPGYVNKGYLERIGNIAVTDMGGDGWWFVRTDSGQRGWVRLSGEYLKLSAAQPGAPTPDPVAALIDDEVANMLYWISVAEGETVCTQGCGDVTWAGTIWSVAEWCRQSGPGYIRKTPGFNPARHETGVATLESTCTALTSAWTRLGEPTNSPAWLEVVAGVKAGLQGR